MADVKGSRPTSPLREILGTSAKKEKILPLDSSLEQLFQCSLETVLQQGGNHPKKPIYVKSTDKVSKAFKLIRKHQITALPVHDSETNQHVSFIEVREIHKTF